MIVTELTNEPRTKNRKCSVQYMEMAAVGAYTAEVDTGQVATRQSGEQFC